MRAALALGSVLLLALLASCDEPDGRNAPPAPPTIVRTPGGPPRGLTLELRMGGGDRTLAALLDRLPPGELRDHLPAHVEPLVDALIAVPPALSGRLADDTSIRVVLADFEGQERSALVVGLASRPDASLLREGGPRGALLLDENTALVDDLAILSDDPRFLAEALPYLAFDSAPSRAAEGSIEVRIPASTLGGAMRRGLERSLEAQTDSLLASARSARAAHEAPPSLGEPEAVVRLLHDALSERLAYLPDLGAATVLLAPTPSGLSLTLSAPITDDSPLALALSAWTAVQASSVAIDDAALVLSTGSTDAAQEADVPALVEALASIAAARLGSEEREALTAASTTLVHARGPRSALALGATEESGAFAALVTEGAPADAALPSPWGRRAPWATSVLAALVGCTPVEPGAARADVPLCDERTLSTRTADGWLAAAAGRGAGERADALLAHATTPSASSSPDLTRDLAALPDAPFALALVRPLRALPLLVALFDLPTPSAGLPRGDGALVVALARDGATLRVAVRASTASLADLAVVARLFAE